MEDHKEKGSPIEEQTAIPLNDGTHPREEGDDSRFSVILRDLSFHCREEHLAQLFQNYRINYSHLIIRRSREGKSLLHAFVDFQSREEALRVIELFHGMKWIGRIMKVELCDRNRNHAQGAPPGFEIHVKYYSIAHQPQPQVTEEVLETIFVQFGHITDIIIRNHTEEVNNQEVTDQHGFAFIYFSLLQSALDANNGQLIFYNIQFNVELSHKTYESLQSLPPPPSPPPLISNHMEWSAGNNLIMPSLHEYQHYYNYAPPSPYYQPRIPQPQPPVYVPPPNYHPQYAMPSQPFPNQQPFLTQPLQTQYGYRLQALSMQQHQHSPIYQPQHSPVRLHSMPHTLSPLSPHPRLLPFPQYGRQLHSNSTETSLSMPPNSFSSSSSESPRGRNYHPSHHNQGHGNNRNSQNNNDSNNSNNSNRNSNSNNRRSQAQHHSSQLRDQL